VGIAGDVPVHSRAVGSTIIRNKLDGKQRFSKRARLGHEMDLLEQRGDQTVMLELQGSLFFGTKDQLYTALEPELGKRATWCSTCAACSRSTSRRCIC
jgi:SulP family sulfate permease